MGCAAPPGVKVGCAAPPAPLRQPRDMSVSGRVAGPPVVNKLEPQIATERHTLRERPHACDAFLTETHTHTTYTDSRTERHTLRERHRERDRGTNAALS